MVFRWLIAGPEQSFSVDIRDIDPTSGKIGENIIFSGISEERSLKTENSRSIVAKSNFQREVDWVFSSALNTFWGMVKGGLQALRYPKNVTGHASGWDMRKRNGNIAT